MPRRLRRRLIGRRDTPSAAPAVFLALGMLCLLAAPIGVRAQEQAARPSTPSSYSKALARLEAADTARALAFLREAVEAAPDHGPAWLKLGTILVARAGQIETEFELRMAAEDALSHAFDLLGPTPDVMLAFGLLYKKRHVQTDVVRVLERAVEGAEEAGAAFTAKERARLHYALASVYETWWEDWRRLIRVPEVARDDWYCDPGLAPALFFVYTVMCPEDWADHIPKFMLVEKEKWRSRDLAIENFALVLRIDSTHVDGGIHLLGLLADLGRWERYLEVARGLVRAAPGDARSHLFLGLGLHRRGRDDEAARAFERGVALLTPVERVVFGDIQLLLAENLRERYMEAGGATQDAIKQLYFTGRDPMYLTQANERRLEHWARVVWTELKFSQPGNGEHGWNSERGRIWIRYGMPWRRMQCCYGLGRRGVIWSYGPEGPNFVFTRKLTYRTARLSETSKFLADNLAAEQPAAYDPVTITSVYGYPHQLARFRGREPGMARVEVYATPPVNSLRGLANPDTFAALTPGAAYMDDVPEDTGRNPLADRVQATDLIASNIFEAGFFVFSGGMRPLWSARDTVVVDEGDPARFTYRFQVHGGGYTYSLEARRLAADSVARPLARVRVRVETTGFPADTLALSDLLLADTLRSRVPSPTTRADLRLVPKHSVALSVGEPLRLYFEVYGLHADQAGLARYRASLSITSEEEENVAVRTLEGLADLFGEDEDETLIEWERVTPVVDGRAMDYLTVDAGALEPGEYAVRIGITDHVTGRSAQRVRTFHVGGTFDE